MNELIRRKDCHIPHEFIFKAMKEEGIEETKDYKIEMLCSRLLDMAESYLQQLPTIATDEVIAYKCPECKTVSILYDPENEQFCPICGIKRRN